MKYTKEYYTNGNYCDYLDRSDRYKRTANELLDVLNNLCLITSKTSILDYGCATGLLLTGIKERHQNCYGYDLSEWALNECVKQHMVYYSIEDLPDTDILIALDVLEHMEDKEITKVFQTILPNICIVRIPVSIDGEKYYLKVSNNDSTHINCKKKLEWENYFKELGFMVIYLNLYSIYTSKGVISSLLIRI